MPYPFLTSKATIIAWLKEHKVEKYKLIPNEEYGFTVDVEERVELGSMDLDIIPVKFNQINGGFWCSYNSLTDLSFAPREVVGEFSCSYNKLTSLEGGPEVVWGNYRCHDNLLTSLKGAPVAAKMNFVCANNSLKSLQYCPSFIDGKMLAGGCELETLKYLPQTIETDYIGIKGNVLLGDKQNINSFKELKQILAIEALAKKEHKKLNKIITQGKTKTGIKNIKI